MQTAELEQVKNLSIVNFLSSMGCEPVKQRGNDWWYCSPLRQEHTPSFHVNLAKNRWHDFGSIDRGGDIINLVEQLHHIGFREALKLLRQDHPWLPTYRHKPEDTLEKKASPFTEIKVGPVTDDQLIAYIVSRGIDISIAQIECKQVSFRLHDKPKLAIGFRNDAGGYELRNAREKMCMSKDVSLRKKGENNSQVCVFEGFFDYLSFLTMMRPEQRERFDYLVLNSTSMVQKAARVLQAYSRVHCYLDNDTAGHEATAFLSSQLGNVTDHSACYAGYNDVNDYLQSQKPPSLSP